MSCEFSHEQNSVKQTPFFMSSTHPRDMMHGWIQRGGRKRNLNWYFRCNHKYLYWTESPSARSYWVTSRRGFRDNFRDNLLQISPSAWQSEITTWLEPLPNHCAILLSWTSAQNLEGGYDPLSRFQTVSLNCVRPPLGKLAWVYRPYLRLHSPKW